MKKILSFMLASAMTFSAMSVGATELTKEQQKDLYSYKIMVGDEDGNLRLTDPITRAEAVKMVCCLGNITVTAEDNHLHDKYFNDIPQDHWAIESINNAKTVDLIDGDQDGNFHPEDTITYPEIIKMVVSVLGYSPMAETMGGYPNGYIITATRLGLTESFTVSNDDSVSRNEVALLITKALDIPIMQQSLSSEDEEYQIMNGEGGTELITRRSLLNQAK